MSIYTASAREARQNFQKNSHCRWFHANANQDEDGNFAFQRLRKTFFTPKIRPEFTLSREDQIFAIGSCFARGIEQSLIAQNMQVLSAAPEFAKFQTANKEVTGLGFTNKYNTFSILNEIRWALDPATGFPKDGLVDVGEGIYNDPHTNPTLELASLEETVMRRQVIQDVTSRIAKCRVVIITLGLVEVWRDRQTGLFINTAPVPQAFKAHPDRFEFHLTNFQQNFANVEDIYELLTKFGHSDLQIVVTVSPVPLMATFTTEDVVVANTYSKSLLRTVAQEWSASHTNVHYFPSYEIVQNSERSAAWTPDLRHVQGALVRHIMQVFTSSYLAGKTP